MLLMGFQEDLRFSFRTKDEVEEENAREEQREIILAADSIYDSIKNQLISVANDGDYTAIDKKKIVSSIVVLPIEFTNFDLIIKENSSTVSPALSPMDRMLKEMTGKSRQQANVVIDKYKGMNFSTFSVPNKNYTSVLFDCSEKINFLVSTLEMLSASDGINIELCVYNKYDKKDYPLHTLISNISADRFYYVFALKCNVTIEENENIKPLTVALNTVFPSAPDDDYFLNCVIDRFSNLHYHSIFAYRSANNDSITVTAYYKGDECSFYCRCHSGTIDEPQIQETILLILDGIDTNIQYTELCEYYYDYFQKNKFYGIKTNNIDRTICITVHKDAIKYSIKYVYSLTNSTAATNEIAEHNTCNIDTMDGLTFEKFCAEILDKNGYENVKVTPGTADQGIDVLAYKDGIKFGFQCKCYSETVGNKAVQEAFAGKTYYKCHIGVVLTNQFFTRSAKELAEVNGIVLWDRNFLIKLIKNSGIDFDNG